MNPRFLKYSIIFSADGRNCDGSSSKAERFIAPAMSSNAWRATGLFATASAKNPTPFDSLTTLRTVRESSTSASPRHVFVAFRMAPPLASMLSGSVKIIHIASAPPLTSECARPVGSSPSPFAKSRPNDILLWLKSCSAATKFSSANSVAIDVTARSNSGVPRTNDSSMISIAVSFSVVGRNASRRPTSCSTNVTWSNIGFVLMLLTSCA